MDAEETIPWRVPQGRRPRYDLTKMTELESLAPLSEDQERRFAGKWVIIRAGQVIEVADTYEDLVEGTEMGARDIVDRLPPDQPTFY